MITVTCCTNTEQPQRPHENRDQGRARHQTWSRVSVRERRARSYQIGKSNDESSRTAHTAGWLASTQLLFILRVITLL